jgi:hypothetical protein
MSKANVIAWPDSEDSNLAARYLQLARKIHAYFTNQEEKQAAVRRAAENLAARKNAVIIRAVQEIVEFCQILAAAPELKTELCRRAVNIAQRMLSNRYAYSLADEPISVSYEVPVYYVDLALSDHIGIMGADQAKLQIGFSPVKLSSPIERVLHIPDLTTYLMNKIYRIQTDGTFTHIYANDNAPADPISDILTELRVRLGHDYFEHHLMPYLESKDAA